MLLAAFEPGKEMAIANFFLAIFCLFTLVLPALLITRGDKTKANREILAAVINPWSQIKKESKLAQVVVTETTSSVELETNFEMNSEDNIKIVLENREVNTSDVNTSLALEQSTPEFQLDDEVLAA